MSFFKISLSIYHAFDVIFIYIINENELNY